MNALHTNKGSATVDAAVCLPVLVVVLGLLLSLVLQTGYEAKLYSDLSRDTAAAAYAYIGGDTCEYTVLGGRSSRFDLYANLYYRPFAGESSIDEDFTNVYVYTKRGEKYHLPGCSTMDYNKNYTVMTVSDAKAAGYTPCLLSMGGGTDYFKDSE